VKAATIDRRGVGGIGHQAFEQNSCRQAESEEGLEVSPSATLPQAGAGQRWQRQAFSEDLALVVPVGVKKHRCAGRRGTAGKRTSASPL